ncbi:NlpC/P60 family protein [Klebsiella michiganensis]|uniref:NlpC/P60 family protein n=1 Tax=Klebsiella michiganensis TaxID=1134687 RepID=UPI003AB2BE3C
MGERVSPRQLRPGDLVFFRIKGGMHVGFYDTDRNFLHASTSQGVMRSIGRLKRSLSVRQTNPEQSTPLCSVPPHS